MIAILRLRRQEPDEAILFSAALAEWLTEAPVTRRENWVLRHAASLCWLLGTWNYYPEALTLAQAIIGRFSSMRPPSARRRVIQTQLQALVALRNTLPAGSEQEYLIAEAANALISEGEQTIEVLNDWEHGLERLGGPHAAPRIVMAETLKAMTFDDLGDTSHARKTIDLVLSRYEADSSQVVQRALEGARQLRSEWSA